MSSNTVRSRKLLESSGWTVWKAERWNAYSRRTEDGFGIFDLLCIHPDHNGVLGVQTTSKANMSARAKKILGSDSGQIWKKSKNQTRIHGWFKLKNRWQVKITDPWEK
jgi:hypothetical protein